MKYIYTHEVALILCSYSSDVHFERKTNGKEKCLKLDFFKSLRKIKNTHEIYLYKLSLLCSYSNDIHFKKLEKKSVTIAFLNSWRRIKNTHEIYFT